MISELGGITKLMCTYIHHTSAGISAFPAMQPLLGGSLSWRISPGFGATSRFEFKILLIA
jgi:hypothetical protein